MLASMDPGGSAADPHGIQERVRAALREALSARDKVAVSALRSALAAIGNAEAVPAQRIRAAGGTSEHFAGAVAGLGTAETERRSLTEAEVSAIIQDEVESARSPLWATNGAGHDDQAGRLRREADVLTVVLRNQL